MTWLLIIRHGNTFNPDEVARRVGCRTDIPLVQSGIDQARALGDYMKRENMVPKYVCASALKRAQETAQIMVHSAGIDVKVETDTCFNEIDHGPDENTTDDEIIERIGQSALDDWSEYGVVPDGWDVDPRAIQQSWIRFADQCVENRKGELSCVVSSGGIIRFAPILLEDNQLPNNESPKVKTASMSLFEYDEGQWRCLFWNQRPK
jgi:2,3-bisphosphoglycerate-dependent phosphoglycerate mutase